MAAMTVFFRVVGVEVRAGKIVLFRLCEGPPDGIE